MTTLVIEHVKAADLPPHWAERLNAAPGQTVTVRIETEGRQHTPAQAPSPSPFTSDDPSFGIWADRDDGSDPDDMLRRARAGRFDSNGTSVRA